MVRDADVEMTIQLVLLSTEPIPTDPTPLSAALRYAVRDPYAVAVCFPAGVASSPVTWTFDRELVASGVRAPAGEGDVHIWPAADRPDSTYIQLSAPAGRALFAAPTAVLQLFIDATTTLLPIGTETDHIDFDAELAAVFGTVL
ncbi:MAG: SsgA family sporulation/cell division regulator [Frankiaceae bacterium]|jgi:hypothetical protein|nr:SsgA family sporulation/cell division regulator [Frankiaceae bacterium]